MYEDFAKQYDSFMDNIPYDMWADQIKGILHKYGIVSGIAADLGCGTGTLTELMAAAGYDMIGIDNSEEMLNQALEKRDKSGHNILYLNQDIRSFELYGTCAAIVSRCDTINYITEYSDLIKCLSLVNNYLDPGGLFIFDVKTEFMYRDLLGYNTFARNNDNGSYIWENYYDEKTKLNQYLLTLYSKVEGKEIYSRSEELHTQRAYSLGEIKNAAAAAGLKWISVIDSDTEDEIQSDTTRYLITLQENGK